MTQTITQRRELRRAAAQWRAHPRPVTPPPEQKYPTFVIVIGAMIDAALIGHLIWRTYA